MKNKKLITLMVLFPLTVFGEIRNETNIHKQLNQKKETNNKIYAPSENGAEYYKNFSIENPSIDELINLNNVSEKTEDLRNQVLEESAYTLGFRGGMANKSNELIQLLNSRAADLDIIFNFSSLISNEGVLPPVIVESNNVASFSTDQIRMANKVYKILIEEHFVSNPPHWSDYLFVGLNPNFKNSDDFIPEGIKPKNTNERKIWSDFISKGWNDGEQQALNIIEANFNRITRDYTGMLRYSELLQYGIIKKGKTAQSIQSLTGDKKEIILGDKLQRLIEKSKFELNIDKWRPSNSPYIYKGNQLK